MSSIVFGLGAVDTFFIPTVQNFLAEVETLQGIPTRKRTSPSSAADRKLSLRKPSRWHLPRQALVITDMLALWHHKPENVLC